MPRKRGKQVQGRGPAPRLLAHPAQARGGLVVVRLLARRARALKVPGAVPGVAVRAAHRRELDRGRDVAPPAPRRRSILDRSARARRAYCVSRVRRQERTQIEQHACVPAAAPACGSTPLVRPLPKHSTTNCACSIKTCRIQAWRSWLLEQHSDAPAAATHATQQHMRRTGRHRLQLVHCTQISSAGAAPAAAAAAAADAAGAAAAGAEHAVSAPGEAALQRRRAARRVRRLPQAPSAMQTAGALLLRRVSRPHARALPAARRARQPLPQTLASRAPGIGAPAPSAPARSSLRTAASSDASSAACAASSASTAASSSSAMPMMSARPRARARRGGRAFSSVRHPTGKAL